MQVVRVRQSSFMANASATSAFLLTINAEYRSAMEAFIAVSRAIMGGSISGPAMVARLEALTSSVQRDEMFRNDRTLQLIAANADVAASHIWNGNLDDAMDAMDATTTRICQVCHIAGY